MLASLFVSDLALIRRLSVDFHRGFSVLTGETGAGKSLILDSLGIFLSSGGEKDLVRRGSEKAEVSLYFTELSENALSLLEDLVSPEEAEEGITLTRVLYAAGKSVSKINGRSIPFGKMSAVAKELLGIHGQMAATSLVDEKKHRQYLDSALSAEDFAIKEKYDDLYSRYTAEKKQLESLLAQSGDEKDEIALLDYKMQEIRKVSPKPGEEEELEKKLLLLQGYEKSYAALHTAYRALEGGEKGKGALYLLNGAARKLEFFGEEEPYSAYSAKLYELASQAQEIAKEISFHLSELGEEDPGEEMDRVQKRLSEIYRLKMRFGKSGDELVSFYEELKEKKNLTLSRKDDIKRGKENLLLLEKELQSTGESLRAARKKTAEKLEKRLLRCFPFWICRKCVFTFCLRRRRSLLRKGLIRSLSE
ncbi:MAG: AAA family ATPase, partial [Clostridia bacterium]|nr:AAA family ATPase [Clostridia bacterium]